MNSSPSERKLYLEYREWSVERNTDIAVIICIHFYKENWTEEFLEAAYAAHDLMFSAVFCSLLWVPTRIIEAEYPNWAEMY